MQFELWSKISPTCLSGLVTSLMLSFVSQKLSKIYAFLLSTGKDFPKSFSSGRSTPLCASNKILLEHYRLYILSFLQPSHNESLSPCGFRWFWRQFGAGRVLAILSQIIKKSSFRKCISCFLRSASKALTWTFLAFHKAFKHRWYLYNI